MVCKTSWAKTWQFKEFCDPPSSPSFKEPRGGCRGRRGRLVALIQQQPSENLSFKAGHFFLIGEPGARRSQQVFFSSGSRSDTLQHTRTETSLQGAAAASTTSSSRSYLCPAHVETELRPGGRREAGTVLEGEEEEEMKMSRGWWEKKKSWEGKWQAGGKNILI